MTASRRRRASDGFVQEPLFDVQPRPEGRYYRQILDALARSGFGDDPAAAQLTVSRLFGTVWAAQPPPRDGATEESFGLGLVQAARRRPSPSAIALLTAIAAVAPIREVREAAAADLEAPQWSVSSGRCWAYEDVYSDRTLMLSEFDDQRGLALRIDHLHASAAVDAALVDDLDGLVRRLHNEAASQAPMVTLRQVEPAWARAIQLRAIARTDLVAGIPTTPAYAETRALALARLAVLPDAPDALPRDPAPLTAADQTAIIAEFLASAPHLADPAYASAIARRLIAYGQQHQPSDVLRVSPAWWERVLAAWPREPGLGPVLRAWSAWAARRRSLPGPARDELASALDEALRPVD